MKYLPQKFGVIYNTGPRLSCIKRSKLQSYHPIALDFFPFCSWIAGLVATLHYHKAREAALNSALSVV